MEEGLVSERRAQTCGKMNVCHCGTHSCSRPFSSYFKTSNLILGRDMADIKDDNKRDPSSKGLIFKSSGDVIGEGDTELLLDFLPGELADVAFERMKTEVAWNVMKHHGKLTNLTSYSL